MEDEKFAGFQPPTDTSPFVLIPFSDPVAFAEAIQKVILDGPLSVNVRVADLEDQTSIGPGICRTPFVVVMVRDKDEFLMLKLLGQTYNYWGKDFADLALALEWVRRVKVHVFDLIGKLELNYTTNSYYYHPHIRNAVGIRYDPDEGLISD